MIKTGIISATIVESKTIICSDVFPTLKIASDADCMISINDNSHYQLYKANEVITLHDKKGTIESLYCNAISDTANIRFWVM